MGHGWIVVYPFPGSVLVLGQVRDYVLLREEIKCLEVVLYMVNCSAGLMANAWLRMEVA